MSATLALKHWLLPHSGNRHQPRILSPGALSLFVCLVLALQLAYNFSVSGQWRVLSFATNIAQAAVVSLTNNERRDSGLPDLAENSALNRAAQAKAEDMFADGYWAHVSPDGTEPWYFFKQAGYNYTYAGENLAKGFNTSSGVISGWLGSPGHKANLLSDRYTDIGVAVVNGVLQGEETTLVVALYGASSDPSVSLQRIGPGQTVTEPDGNGAAGQATEELAPTPRDYSAVKPLLISKTMDWGQFLVFGAAGSLVPVYMMTHAQMWRHQLHHTGRWLWRRRWLEFGALVGLLGSLIVSGFGSVG